MPTLQDAIRVFKVYTESRVEGRGKREEGRGRSTTNYEIWN